MAAKESGVSEHPLVKRLVPDPAKGPLGRPMRGYPGPSPVAGFTRLYNQSLDQYLDIPNEGILYEDHSGSEPQGPYTLWVKSDTTVQQGRFAKVVEDKDVVVIDQGRLDPGYGDLMTRSVKVGGRRFSERVSVYSLCGTQCGNWCECGCLSSY